MATRPMLQASRRNQHAVDVNDTDAPRMDHRAVEPCICHRINRYSDTRDAAGHSPTSPFHSRLCGYGTIWTSQLRFTLSPAGSLYYTSLGYASKPSDRCPRQVVPEVVVPRGRPTLAHGPGHASGASVDAALGQRRPRDRRPSPHASNHRRLAEAATGTGGIASGVAQRHTSGHFGLGGVPA